jgi:hypothetical protein
MALAASNVCEKAVTMSVIRGPETEEERDLGLAEQQDDGQQESPDERARTRKKDGAEAPLGEARRGGLVEGSRGSRGGRRGRGAA